MMAAQIGNRIAGAVRRFRVPWTIRLAGVWLLCMVIISLFAPWIAPYSYAEQHLQFRFALTGDSHGDLTFFLGTDHLGRDILSRIIYAIRTSIFIALAGTTVGAFVGVTLGFIAARFRGFADHAIMMAVDAQASLPPLFLALGFLAFFGNNIIIFILVVSLDGWERYTRLVRGLVKSEQQSDYIRAVEGLGARPRRVLFAHILPNIVASLVVQVTLNFPSTILLETSLSFLGLGIQPPGTSLGLMLGEGRRYLLNAPWIAVYPGSVILLTTLSICLLGDWARDHFDPTLNGSGS
jgi:peptide/nickel transport system permease protein